MHGSWDVTMYCSVCGGPMSEENGHSDWLTSATLLCEGSQSQDAAGPAITSLTAAVDGGPYFNLTEPATTKEVVACDVAILDIFVDDKPKLYIPLHTHCLSIVEQVAVPNITASREEMLQRLWHVLHAQFLTAGEGRRVPPNKFWVPSGYYGIHRFRDMMWEPGSRPTSQHEAGYFTADPVDIPDLTSTILQNLEPLPPNLKPSSGAFAFESPAAARLPPEVVEAILTQMRPFDESTLESTYQISAPYWKNLLVQGLVLPWLPKLDASSVDASDRQRQDTIDWDWEKLVRRLGALPFRDGPLDAEKEGFKIAKGVWNRRRIWQLAEDLLTNA